MDEKTVKEITAKLDYLIRETNRIWWMVALLNLTILVILFIAVTRP